MELIYKLDLPEMTEILTERAKRRLYMGSDRPLYLRFHPRDILRPEWINYRDIPWNFVSFFYKNNYRGILHSDNIDTSWGINWIHQGHGVIEYWEENDVIRWPISADSVGAPVIMCSAMAPPSRVYTLMPGAYLFNARVPHRPSGFNRRYALSLRCTTMTLPWAQVVDLFNDLIIPQSML